MRILIIKLGAIGDVLRTTSALKGLREKYSPACLDWLTSEVAKEVLLHNPLIDHLYTWPEKKRLKPYDLVIGLEDELKVREFVSKISQEEILGAFADGYTPSSWFDMSAISRFGLEKANELKRLNKKTFQEHLGELLGVRYGGYVFQLTPEEIEYGRNFVKGLGIGRGKRIIGVNTGAGKRWQMKALGIEKTIELIKILSKELGVASLILGGKEEEQRNQIIAKETVMPSAGVHSIRHFAAIINQCEVVVTSDSLAMHLAIALGKKLVVFFGPTSATEIELYGLGEKIQPQMDCLVCYRKTCDKKPSCMAGLSLAEIVEVIKCRI
ncbi:MAG: glycosyltransferase family 9 protein [Candidatus Margulisbacteria bacterium]|nr:glycosyltransferase family 9 protein [Candidatus Margulisiibacteriota bacterium]